MASRNKIMEYIIAIGIEGEIREACTNMMGPMFDEMIKSDQFGGAQNDPQELQIVKEETTTLVQRMTARQVEAMLENIGEKLTDEDLDELIKINRSPLIQRTKAIMKEYQKASMPLMFKILQEETEALQQRIEGRISSR